MKGMTAFGKAKQQNDALQITAEISSVNRRHAEIIVKVPPGYQELESFIRKELLEKIARGQVTVTIDISACDATSMAPTINWPWIETQVAVIEKIGTKLGAIVPTEKVVFELWKQVLLQKQTIDCTKVVPLLLQTLQTAYALFDAQKVTDGSSLEKDFRTRLAFLRTSAEKISLGTKTHVEDVKKKIVSLLKDVVSEPFTSDERVMREVVLQADKADISEELVRIQHHLDHFEKVLSEKTSVGKLLEFILQELLREFNTLGSKTTIPSVATLVVLAKTELEKMREQVQNVE